MIKKVLRSVGYAWNGLSYVWRTQHNFRLGVLLGALAFLTGIVFNFSEAELALVVLAAALVLGAEIFNAVGEKMLDELHPGPHPIVGKMKDMLAGAVLLMGMGAAVIFVIILSHRLAR